MLRETYPMRTVATLADFSAAQMLWFVIAINVSRTNNEKARGLIFVIVVTSDSSSPKVETRFLSQRLTDLLGKAKIENPLRRHGMRGFDTLRGDRNHFALERFIHGAR